MSSSYFSRFAKSLLVFRESDKPSLKIDEVAAYIGPSLKPRFQRGIFNVLLRQPHPNLRGLPQDAKLPLPSLILSDLLYAAATTGDGGRMADEILTIREVYTAS